MRRTPLTTFAFSLMFGLAACSGDKDPAGGADAGPPDLAGNEDSAVPDAADASVADTTPPPCVWDQGGRANRGCDPGEVCNLAMNPAQCVPGIACSDDTECNKCSDFGANQEECGHGFHVVAFCDTRHAAPGTDGTCTRSRAPCEQCEVDDDCGRIHPILGGGQNRCLDYGGEGFCGRPCGRCPDGFVCDSTSSQCRRDLSQGGMCAEVPSICPADDMMGITCAGTDQICPTEICPNTGNARCSTNDQPGALGTCIGFCTMNSDCPAATPICNVANGICISGCTKDSCAAGLACHLDGFCRAPCADNDECVSRFGVDTYCNEPGQPPPRFYKPYHDNNSCRALGCEDKRDCQVAGIICDKTQAPPACVTGCFEEADCMPGHVCRSLGGQQPRPTYTREQCRALPEKTVEEEIGVCCDAGCRKRDLSCQINEWCCAENGSPYEDPGACLALTSTGGATALPGQCFEASPEPWCHVCTDLFTSAECNSGWTPGYNTDPNHPTSPGLPFQEQELCMQIAMGLNICSVTCNPTLPDTQCPRGWSCQPFTPGCFQDADCSGLECVGEVPDDPTTPDINEQRAGRCKCGDGGVQSSACPTVYVAPNLGEAAIFPRCVDIGNAGQDMFCVVSNLCVPPAARPGLYPAACGFD